MENPPWEKSTTLITFYNRWSMTLWFNKPFTNVFLRSYKWEGWRWISSKESIISKAHNSENRMGHSSQNSLWFYLTLFFQPFFYIGSNDNGRSFDTIPQNGNTFAIFMQPFGEMGTENYDVHRSLRSCSATPQTQM